MKPSTNDKAPAFAPGNLMSRHTLFIVLLALAARLPHFLATMSVPVHDDQIDYDALGWNMAQGKPFNNVHDYDLLYNPVGTPTAFRTPGLPAFAAAHYVLVGHRPVFVRVSLVLLNALAAGALFAWTRRRYGGRIGWITGLAWALWPTQLASWIAADQLYAESLATPLVIFAIAALAHWKKLGGAAVAGLLLGAAVLTRGYLILMVPLALVLTFLFERPRAGGLRRFFVLGAACALVIVPWTARNYAVFGKVIPLSTQEGLALWLGNNTAARGSWNGHWDVSPETVSLLQRHPEVRTVSEIEKSKIYRSAAIAEMRAGGVRRFVALESKKLLLFFYPADAKSGFQPGFLLMSFFFPIGVVVMARRHREAVDFALLACVGTLVLTTLIIFHDTRYRVTGEAAMVVVSSIGASRVWAFAMAKLRRAQRQPASQPAV